MKSVEFGLSGSADRSLASVQLLAGEYPLRVTVGPMQTNGRSSLQRMTLESPVIDPSTGELWLMSVTIDSTLINGRAFQNVPALVARRADRDESEARLISHLGNKQLMRLQAFREANEHTTLPEPRFSENEPLFETRFGELQLFSTEPGTRMHPGRATLYLSLKATRATRLYQSRMSGDLTLDREPGAWSVSSATISLQEKQP